MDGLIEHNGILLLVILLAAVVVVYFFLISCLFARYKHALFPTTSTLSAICHICTHDKLELTDVGIMWKLVWYYPLMLLPIVIVVCVWRGVDPLAVSALVVFVAYLLLFTLVKCGWLQVIVGKANYRCPACGTRYHYVREQLVPVEK